MMTNLPIAPRNDWGQSYSDWADEVQHILNTFYGIGLGDIEHLMDLVGLWIDGLDAEEIYGAYVRATQ